MHYKPVVLSSLVKRKAEGGFSIRVNKMLAMARWW